MTHVLRMAVLRSAAALLVCAFAVRTAAQAEPTLPVAAPPAAEPIPSADEETRDSQAPAPRFFVAQRDVVLFGTDRDGFTNAAFGLRLDYAALQALRAGLEVAYANLHGAQGRAHSVLALLGVQARSELSTRWSVSGRIALGHLFRNGMVVQWSAGVGFKLARRLTLLLEVAPTLLTTQAGVFPAIGPAIGFELAM